MPDPVPFPPEDVEGSLHGRFARVAATRASALAIAQGSVRLTYEEVDRRSDALAAAIARSAPAHLAPVVILVATRSRRSSPLSPPGRRGSSACR
jgi:non-ribosomal peptide synthetase component F